MRSLNQVARASIDNFDANVPYERTWQIKRIRAAGFAFAGPFMRFFINSVFRVDQLLRLFGQHGKKFPAFQVLF